MALSAINLPESENLIVWKDRFLIGIPIIDMEHKRLVKLCNTLYKVVMLGNNAVRKGAVSIVLRECMDYVKTHFEHEEKLMKVCGYKDFDMHKREHEEFKKTVLKKSQNPEKETFLSSKEFVRFLYDWILSHIAHTDRLYVDDLKAYLGKNKIPMQKGPLFP